MPDYRALPDEPRNWSEAFAALPLATPDEDLWARLKTQIPTPAMPVRRHRHRTAAAAAVLAMALLLPVAWMQRAPAPQPATDLAHQTAAVTTSPGAGPASPPQNESSSPTPTLPSASTAWLPSAAPAPTPRPSNHPSMLEPKQASTALAGTPAAPLVTPKIDVLQANAPQADPLPARYARSAQLESLLAEISDERVTSGAAATLAVEYESRLALIDASLSDPALSQPARVELWDERIAALQQLVAFAGTQRWLNAQGEHYDGQLVSVY